MINSIDELGINWRAQEILKEVGITSIRDLCALSTDEIVEIERKTDLAVWTAYALARRKLRKLGLWDMFRNLEKPRDGKTKSVSHDKPLTLDSIGLTLHTKKCLEKAGITTVYGLLLCTEKQLLKIHTLGKKEVKDIIHKLKNKGLSLRSVYE